MVADFKSIGEAAANHARELSEEIAAARRSAPREYETLDADFDRLLGRVRDLAQLVAAIAEAS